ncbi:M15 family metallopeptidase [Aquimarina brevivitae]|uniref:D-alanyl-D-alanine dipeptidase n=1 Tax=Aquimarina brevivitae TaxID=323412 RepID=A0A4Q7PLF1_9FLAO|nr:M15 family metallopeptidase [Aquimarina brevivitae]RZS99802.1 D-alanyl-D-alanine dipeptidase [Aquimarina brevivitae]
MIKKLLAITLIIGLFSCDDSPIKPSENTLKLIEKSKQLQDRAEVLEKNIKERDGYLSKKDASSDRFSNIQDDEFVNIEELSNNFMLDMRYATNNNFLKESVYDCAKCFVRGKVAKAILQAQKELMRKGYRIQFFDCYRPHSVQKKMWKIVSDPGYVANPKGGSVHNRGAAIDITLTDLKGNPLDMGTDFDHFGKEAAHAYAKLSDEVKENRKLLRTTMEKYGFTTIRTEWWHYNFQGGKKYEIADFTWDCQ